MNARWQSEYLAHPEPPNRKLHELAIEYHTRCEAYDRTVCTGPIGKEGILPSNADELMLINRNARIVRDDIERKAKEAGIEVAEMARAIRCWRPQ